MPFLTFNNANIQFTEKKLTWRSYTIVKALPTTKQVELINNDKFSKAALNKKSEMFVVYIAALKALLLGMTIHFFLTAQIIGDEPAQVAVLNSQKASTKVLAKYLDFLDVFSAKKNLMQLKQTEFNKYIIKLNNDKQSLYLLIYNLKLV